MKKLLVTCPLRRFFLVCLLILQSRSTLSFWVFDEVTTELPPDSSINQQSGPNDKKIWGSLETQSTSYPFGKWNQPGHREESRQWPNIGDENPTPTLDSPNRGYMTIDYNPHHNQGNDLLSYGNDRADSNQRLADNHNPLDRSGDTSRYADPHHPPRYISPPWIPNVDHEHPQLHTKLHDCKCVCDNDSKNPRSINVLRNFGDNFNRNPITWCLLGNPEEGSVPPPTQGRFPDIPRLPQSVPHASASSPHDFTEWVSGEIPTDSTQLVLVHTLDSHTELSNVNDFLRQRHAKRTSMALPTKNQHTTEEAKVVRLKPNPTQFVPEENQPMIMTEKPEFRNRHEMSESAVAGLVCGIFAVVVLIVVVVVSRKVIVNSAKRVKRAESDGNSYEDPSVYEKSSSGYPPRYL